MIALSPEQLRWLYRATLVEPMQLDLFSEEASELYVDEVLDGQGRLQYVDSSLSVSASTEDGRP